MHTSRTASEVVEWRSSDAQRGDDRTEQNRMVLYRRFARCSIQNTCLLSTNNSEHDEDAAVTMVMLLPPTMMMLLVSLPCRVDHDRTSYKPEHSSDTVEQQRTMILNNDHTSDSDRISEHTASHGLEHRSDINQRTTQRSSQRSNCDQEQRQPYRVDDHTAISDDGTDHIGDHTANIDRTATTQRSNSEQR